ncbi:hypothetical protein C7I85_28215 [Mesorhizobium soli]|uniref:Uncharacterized protein n=1 Tax=Pseudaminobacter soli (ex Li et al. 2025) TaxID=1295366 RepID=A0A2P7RSM2_9HYPH|nr:hypothetical protein C7I85_28215 [Mesorhizobium soli]
MFVAQLVMQSTAFETCRAMAALEVLDIALLAEASLGQCRNLVPLVTFAFRITNGSSWRNRDLQRGRR